MLAKNMGSPTLATSYEGCSGKKEEAENWKKAKRKYDFVGGTPFNGVRAIAKEHDVAIARLKRYADRNAKHNHGYDTDSLALVSDSGSDDSWDGDSDATM